MAVRLGMARREYMPRGQGGESYQVGLGFGYLVWQRVRKTQRWNLYLVLRDEVHMRVLLNRAPMTRGAVEHFAEVVHAKLRGRAVQSFVETPEYTDDAEPLSTRRTPNRKGKGREKRSTGRAPMETTT